MSRYMARRRRDAQHEALVLRAFIWRPRRGWRDRASCAGLKNWWSLREADALLVCRWCPSRMDCVAWACQLEVGLAEVQVVGVFGVPAAARQVALRSHREQLVAA